MLSLSQTFRLQAHAAWLELFGEEDESSPLPTTSEEWTDWVLNERRAAEEALTWQQSSQPQCASSTSTATAAAPPRAPNALAAAAAASEQSGSAAPSFWRCDQPCGASTEQPYFRGADSARGNTVVRTVGVVGSISNRQPEQLGWCTAQMLRMQEVASAGCGAASQFSSVSTSTSINPMTRQGGGRDAAADAIAPPSCSAHEGAHGWSAAQRMPQRGRGRSNSHDEARI